MNRYKTIKGWAKQALRRNRAELIRAFLIYAAVIFIGRAITTALYFLIKWLFPGFGATFNDTVNILDPLVILAAAPLLVGCLALCVRRICWPRTANSRRNRR